MSKQDLGICRGFLFLLLFGALRFSTYLQNLHPSRQNSVGSKPTRNVSHESGCNGTRPCVARWRRHGIVAADYAELGSFAPGRRCFQGNKKSPAFFKARLCLKPIEVTQHKLSGCNFQNPFLIHVRRVKYGFCDLLPTMSCHFWIG